MHSAMPARPIAMAPLVICAEQQSSPSSASCSAGVSQSGPAGPSFPYGVGIPQYFPPPVGFTTGPPASSGAVSGQGGNSRGTAGARSGTCASRHMAAEQRRRARINERLDALRSLVPHTARANTAAFLTEVHDYIVTLHKRLKHPGNDSGGNVFDLNTSASGGLTEKGDMKSGILDHTEDDEVDDSDQNPNNETQNAVREKFGGRKRERDFGRSDEEESEVEWEEGDRANGEVVRQMSPTIEVNCRNLSHNAMTNAVLGPAVKKPHAQPHPSLVLSDRPSHPSFSSALSKVFSEPLVKPTIGESNGRSAFSPPTPPQSTSPNNLIMDVHWSSPSDPPLSHHASDGGYTRAQGDCSSPPLPQRSSSPNTAAPPCPNSRTRPREIQPTPPMPSPLSLSAPAPMQPPGGMSVPVPLLPHNMHPHAVAAAAVAAADAAAAAQHWGMAAVVAQAQAQVAAQAHVQALVNAAAAAAQSSRQSTVNRGPAPPVCPSQPHPSAAKRRRKIAGADRPRSAQMVVRPIAIKPQV